MQHAIMLGSTVRCADGKAGIIDGLIVNPNRNHIDYIVLKASAGEETEYFVPGGQLARAGARELSLPYTWSQLEDLPHPDRAPRQGSVLSNLPDLVVARDTTIVRDSAGDRLGVFQGAIVDSNLEIQALLLAETPDRAIPIAQLARHSDAAGDLIAELVHQPEGPQAAPVL